MDEGELQLKTFVRLQKKNEHIEKRESDERARVRRKQTRENSSEEKKYKRGTVARRGTKINIAASRNERGSQDDR